MIIHIKKHKTIILIITFLSVVLLPILVFTLNQTATIDGANVCVGLENGGGITIQDRENNSSQELRDYCFDQDSLVVFTCTDGVVNDTGSIYEANIEECAVGCSGGACIEDPADAGANVCVFDEGQRTAAVFNPGAFELQNISNYCASDTEKIEVACGEGNEDGYLVSKVVDCGENGVCDNGECFQVVLAACADDNPCANGLLCENNECRVPLLGGCDISAQCIEGHVCSGGECKVEEGGACDGNNPCAALLLCSDVGICIPDIPARRAHEQAKAEARARMFGVNMGVSVRSAPTPTQQDSASGQAGAAEESTTATGTEGEALQVPVAEETILDHATCRILE
ncbi:MAG: hypothetical protein CL685_04210 [Candidatus Magasanikbacteria bacterium]|nr:hypothetical protein [Candidatus Magasanikbacteria bacterium]